MKKEEYNNIKNIINLILENFYCNYKNIYFDYQDGLRIKIVCLENETIDNYDIILKNPGSSETIKKQDEFFAFNNISSNIYSVKFLKRPKKNYDFEILRNGKKYFSHKFSLKNKNVLLVSPNIESIEENIAFYSNCEKFFKKNNSKNYIILNDEVEKIIKNKNNIFFINKNNEIKNIKFYYNNIKYGFFEDLDNNEEEKNNFFKSSLINNENSLFKEKINYDFFIKDIIDKNNKIKNFISNYTFLKCNYGIMGSSSYILEVDKFPENVFEIIKSKKRIIKEPYVCIHQEANEIKKLWLYKNGWNDVIKYLKSIGYRVLNVGNSKEFFINDIKFNFLNETEDFTHLKTLQEKINLIKDADFFIGLSFDISWLAWLCKIPIVLISGSTIPDNEFYTPYRVYPTHGCAGCENNVISKYFSFFNKISGFKTYECPMKETNNGCISKKVINGRFECSKNITSKDVIDKIKEIPIVKEKINNIKLLS